jgi:putative flippase GtrA
MDDFKTPTSEESEVKASELSSDKEAAQLSKKAEMRRALKYLLFTSSAGLIQVISFTILNELVFKDGKYGPSYFIALTLSVIWNFTFNRKFTFKSANNVPIAMFKVFCYYLVFTPLSIWWGEALTGIGWNEYLVLGITMFINLVTEFTFNRFVVFGKTLDTNELAKKEKEKAEHTSEEIKEESKE